MNNTDEIEFSRVRKLVAHYAVSPEAKEKILAQRLANKLVKANALLDETEEMVWILDHGLHIPFINSDAFTPIINKGIYLKASRTRTSCRLYTGYPLISTLF